VTGMGLAGTTLCHFRCPVVGNWLVRVLVTTGAGAGNWIVRELVTSLLTYGKVRVPTC
jgi:hypothetical protein